MVLKGREQYVHISNWWHSIKTEMLRKKCNKGRVYTSGQSGPSLTGCKATPNDTLAEVSIPVSLKNKVIMPVHVTPSTKGLWQSEGDKFNFLYPSSTHKHKG